jgi:hypothetical protein
MDFQLEQNKMRQDRPGPNYLAKARVHSKISYQMAVQRLAYGSTITETDVHAVLTRRMITTATIAMQ